MPVRGQCWQEEHLSPAGRRDYLAQQHVARYHFAAGRLVAGQKVLDVACGSGYGTAILRRRGCEVTGADYNAELVAHAARTYGGRFVRANALDLPFDDCSFDALVSFETIEHVADGARFLGEMRRVLKPGGIFICSTPNVLYTAHPPYHVKEYEPVEFYALVEEFFTGVERYAQHFGLWERMKDLARMNLPQPLKTGLKRILRARPASKTADSVAGGFPEYLVFEERYGVVPCGAEGGLLRIMVATGKKDAKGVRPL